MNGVKRLWCLSIFLFLFITIDAKQFSILATVRALNRLHLAGGIWSGTCPTRAKCASGTPIERAHGSGIKPSGMGGKEASGEKCIYLTNTRMGPAFI